MRGAIVLSSNFYLHGREEGDNSGVRSLTAARVTSKTHIVRDGSHWKIAVELTNRSKVPALMVRAKVTRSKSGDVILPALFSDNYLALMPGEKQTISVSVEDADTRGEKPAIRIEGYNLAGSSTR
jgi:hypothetical protein